MSGTADSVLIAQFLVQSNIEFFRWDRDGGASQGGDGGGGNVLDRTNNPEAMMGLNQMNQMLAGARNDIMGQGGGGYVGNRGGYVLVEVEATKCVCHKSQHSDPDRSACPSQC